VAEGVKKQDPNVPVILVSGWAIQQDEPRIRESGVDRVLQKPCTMAKFREIVQETLRDARNGGNGVVREPAAL